jgi:predicted alpha/beta superfamily hydrolase
MRIFILGLLAVLGGCGGGNSEAQDVTAGLDVVAEVLSDIPADSAPAHELRIEDSRVADDNFLLPETLETVDAEPELMDIVPELPPVVVPPATIDDFLELVESSDEPALQDFLKQYDGPFCEGVTCLFVTCVDGAAAINLRGEFNEWEQTPMLPLEFAPGCFYYLFEELLFAYVMEYKLFVADEWLRDPLNRYFRFADAAMNSALYAPGYGRLVLVEGIYSPQLDNSRNLYVYLPAAAIENPGLSFPVLYMQDGFNIFDNPNAPFGNWFVDVAADYLMGAGEVAPVIIVGIDTDNRFDEYLYTDLMFDMGEEFIIVDPKLPAYGKFLVETVKPLIDDQFPTRLDRESTAIAGSSLGGISALYIGWYFAETFGKVASLSGSYWIGETPATANNPAMRDLLLAYEPTWEQLALTVYLDSGSAPEGDPTPNPYTVDARCYTDWTRNALIELGWSNRIEWDDDGLVETPPNNLPEDSVPASVKALFWSPNPPADYTNWDDFLLPGANLLHLVGAGQFHTEGAWEARFPAALRFLFPVM